MRKRFYEVPWTSAWIDRHVLTFEAIERWARTVQTRLSGMDLIATLALEEISRLDKTIPTFAPCRHGDRQRQWATKARRKRVQAYEGVVIARRNRGLNSNCIVRKIYSGEGVERTFQLYSPLIASIEVKRRGDVRRAKLYYLRECSGKSARIKEKLS